MQDISFDSVFILRTRIGCFHWADWTLCKCAWNMSSLGEKRTKTERDECWIIGQQPDKFRMKLCKSYSVVNKVGTLSIMTNTQNKDVRMYINEFILVVIWTYTLLYKVEVVKMHGICSSLYTNTTIEEKGWDCSQMYNWHCVVNRITMKWEHANLWELMCELPFHCLARSCHLEVLMVISIDSLLIKQLRKLLNVILAISLFTWQDDWRK